MSKRIFNQWTTKEDILLVKTKLEEESPYNSTKKIIKALKEKNPDKKRTPPSIHTRLYNLKKEYGTENFNEILQKLKKGSAGKNYKNPQKEDDLGKMFNEFYEEKVSPYLKKFKDSFYKTENSLNPLNQYTAKNYFVLNITDVENKLNDKEKSQLEKILEKLENKENRKTKKTRENKTKKYPYSLPELTPSEIREKILELKKQNATNDSVYDAFPSKYRRNVSAYLAHVTMGHYHKRGLIN